MTITTIKSETIIVKNPSDKLMNMLHTMKECKERRRARMREIKPMFTIKA